MMRVDQCVICHPFCFVPFLYFGRKGTGLAPIPERPLIYNIAWKALIYVLVSALIHYLERLYDFARRAGGIAAGNEKLLAEIVWPHFWAIQIILFVLILMYCTMHELGRVIGKEKLLRIFFGPVPAETV